MYNGYLSLGGTEIANSTRLKAYVTNNAPHITYKNCEECDGLLTALGDTAYTTPSADEAPWYDPIFPVTNEFYGVSILAVEGIEDSTGSVPVTEAITDGGSIGQMRLATRAIRVKVLMVARNEYAMSYGMTWLRNALRPPPCTDHGGGSCGGAQLCYYAACPDEIDYEHYERTLHEVATLEGPSIISEYKFGPANDCTGVVREVDFTFIAGRPSPYGHIRNVLDHIHLSDMTTALWYDPTCADPDVVLVDPDCVIMESPPRPPIIPTDCITYGRQWQRYWTAVPAAEVAAWTTTVPQVVITTGITELRQLRVRVYPNPFGRDPLDGTTLYRTNLAQNPRAYNDMLGWSALAATGTPNQALVPRPYSQGPTPLEKTQWGTVEAQATANTANLGAGFGNPSVASPPYKMAVTAGTSYTASGWMAHSDSGTALNGQAYIRWYNSSNVFISSSSGTLRTGLGVYVDNKVWHKLDVTATAPAGAAYAEVRVLAIHPTSTIASGQRVWVTGIMLTTTSTGTEYFDGMTRVSGGYYYGWTGDAHESASHAMTSPIDPCGFCSEFVVSYLPRFSTLTVDGILGHAYAVVEGFPPVPADHLLYSADGSPMTWPELQCGMEYLVAVDSLTGVPADVFFTFNVATKE